MSTGTFYPRILIVYHSCINAADNNCMSLRSWLANWPRESLAQLYTGNDLGGDKFCGHNFCLGSPERRWGRLFAILKQSSLGEASRPPTSSRTRAESSSVRAFLRRMSGGLSSFLVNSGLWELMFAPRLSDRLWRWVEAFQPDVVYVQGYRLTIVRLALALKGRTGKPICYHAVDDWPAFLYHKGVVGPVMGRLVERSAASLISCASARFAIGKEMASAYAERYGAAFDPLMICDDRERFPVPASHAAEDGGTIRILYTGGLAHRRWESLDDLGKAAEILEKRGKRVQVEVYCSAVPPEARTAFDRRPHLQLSPLPSHQELPEVLSRGDILFLPESFDPYESEVVHLSVSTKAPLYMMSGVPVLVYGGSACGVVEYARREGWAHVVACRSAGLLADAVAELCGETHIRETITARAQAVVEANHDGPAVRERLRKGLAEIAGEVRERDGFGREDLRGGPQREAIPEGSAAHLN